jgi:hypothetical protein
MSFLVKRSRVASELGNLVGLQVFKSWNVFGTRMFYFAAPDSGTRPKDGDFRLTLECAWRIEHGDNIVVGCDDYGVRAVGNEDPSWNPREMQWGHLQDQKLEELLGEARGGEIFNTRSDLVVESVEADAVGGFRLGLSGGYVLAAFPGSIAQIEWLLSRRAGGCLELMNGILNETEGGERTQPSR